MKADTVLDVEAVRAARAWAVGVDAACALGLVQHGTRDVAWKPALPLGGPEGFDARIDLTPHVGRERVETFAEELPFGTTEARHVGKPSAARVAATTARPPRVRLARGARAPVDLVIDREEPGSHAGGFVHRTR